MRGLALLAVLVAGPAWAQEALDGDAFEALVEGRTLTYERTGEGEPYGVERYYPGRRVTWFLVGTGECLEGEWHEAGTPEAPQICFTYDASPGPHCFLYARQGDTILSTDLDGGDLDLTPLGAAHGIAFGCDYLGA